MNRLALGFFLAALGCFIGFHFVLFQTSVSGGDDSDYIGWKIWMELFDFLGSVQHADAEQMIAWSGFSTGAILIVSSPLLVSVLKRSRMLWWIGILSSGTAMLGLGGVIVAGVLEDDSMRVGPGLICLLAALAFNFLGFVFIRREVPPCPVVDPMLEDHGA